MAGLNMAHMNDSINNLLYYAQRSEVKILIVNWDIDVENATILPARASATNL